MKIRTIIITAVLTLSMAAGMAGCAGGNGSVSDTSSVSQVSQENGSGYSDDNDTKVLQMLDKVTLNGKPMKIPYKQSDLRNCCYTGRNLRNFPFAFHRSNHRLAYRNTSYGVRNRSDIICFPKNR